MNNDGSVTLNIQSAIATINFYHPSGNSFPKILLHQFSQIIEDLNQNESVSVLVIKSEGNGAFCAGASFDELIAIKDFEEGKTFFSGFARLLNALRKSNKITIARVQGKAVGGGVGLISSCDYVYAIEEANIKLSEIAIGIGPFVIEPAVSRKMGVQAMNELTLNPHKWMSAKWAKENNLYNQIFTTIEDLDSNLDLFISSLSKFNPEALREYKKILWHNTSHWEELLYERAAISGKLVLSDFTKNALSQFKK